MTPERTKILVLDTEATTYEKGNPFSRSNRLCCVGVYDGAEYRYFSIEHTDEPYGGALESLYQLLKQTKLLVGFNLKYDLHWIRRYIPSVVLPPVWDAQLGEFLLHNQRNPYPSLDFAAQSYGLGTKSVSVSEKYWAHGIDTDKIPREELEEYNKQDCILTWGVYEKQKELLESGGYMPLFNTQCADLLTLQEMEFNGMYFDTEKAKELNESTVARIAEVERDLAALAGRSDINWNSSHHVSAVLYGGTIPVPAMEEVTTVTKSGKTRTYTRKCFRHESLPRLVEPLPNTESKHEGIFFTNEDVLRSLRATGNARRIINLILEQSELEKLRSTYYQGIPELIDKMAWEPSIIHGTFNQCVARTGRLSSSKPNLQNFATAIKPLFRSRNGILINTDAKGLEWVCAAYLSQDQTAKEEIIAGVDQHALNQQYFGLPSRLIAKVFMFRLIYGGSAWSYAHDPDFTDVSTRESFWQAVIDKTYDKYRGLRDWHIKLVQEVVNTGRLHMPTGRQYKFDRIRGDWPRTQILNYPVQGLGADLLSIIRVSLYKRLSKGNYQSQIVSTVHDSILLDAVDNERERVIMLIDSVFKDMNRNFERVFGVKFDLPLRCETSVGVNWGDMEVVN